MPFVICAVGVCQLDMHARSSGMVCRPRAWQTLARRPSGCLASSWAASSVRCWQDASLTPSLLVIPREATVASVSRYLPLLTPLTEPGQTYTVCS